MMEATDKLHPIQFRKNRADRDYAAKNSDGDAATAITRWTTSRVDRQESFRLAKYSDEDVTQDIIWTWKTHRYKSVINSGFGL